MAYISSTLFATFGTAATVALVYYVLLHRREIRSTTHPPGPKVATMPYHDVWIEYRRWGKEFGDLVYFHDQKFLIINKSQVAIDLLEKRSRIYSDRRMTTMLKLSGGEMNLAAAHYSDSWRRKRKLFQQNFRQASIDRFYPEQYDKVQEFLRRLITTPEKFLQHTLSLSQRMIFSSLYGLDVESNDPLAQKAVKTIFTMVQAVLPGAHPILERFPWLRYMPSWFPGCEFKKTAMQCLRDIKEANTVPFDMAKTGKGTSLIAELATKCEGDPAEIEAIKAMGTTSYLAAADTTKSSISSFILAMVLNPDVQTKGQEELDRVLGKGRLPTFNDRLSLPYIEAIYREVMRLHPPLPIGIEHSLTEDDFYLGYHIPKGCSVIPNIWAMNRDPDVYSRPDDFLPERFLENPSGPFTDLGNILAYGFGRRVCVGRYMADNTVWLTIASVLATLDLGKAKDKEGNEIPISEEFTHHFFRHPEPYQCSITPRTANTEALILSTAP